MQVNANDNDGGILVGNWSGNYSDGTSPLAWSGSGAILEQFWRTKKAVNYAQCWVFGGTLTSGGWVGPDISQMWCCVGGCCGHIMAKFSRVCFDVHECIRIKWRTRDEYTVTMATACCFTTCHAVLRCLGIPSRPLSNFASAHDTKANRSIDYYYDENYYPISYISADSIWWAL